MSRPALSLAVVGADHPNTRGPTRRFEIAICKPGDAVELRREPKNKADERAVAVFSSRGVQLGYLAAEKCAWIGGMLINGRELRAIFQASTQFGALIRVAFDGDGPELPTHSTPKSHRDDPDFYPDEIPPDDF